MFSEKDIERPRNDCTNNIRHEEADQKEVVKQTRSIVRNSERRNPQIKLSDGPGNHQGHNYLGSSSVRNAFAMDDKKDSSFPKGKYNLSSNPSIKSLVIKPSSHVENGYKCSLCSSHASQHKKQHRLGEDSRVNLIDDRWNPQSDDDSEYESPDYRHDDHLKATQVSDASHGIGQDLVSKAREGCNKYKHDDHRDDDHAGSSSNRKRRKLEFHDQKRYHCVEYQSSKIFRQHVLYFRNKNSNKNIITDERDFRSGKIQKDDEEPFDICSMPNIFTPRELSPPPQSNETYKEIQNLMPGMFLLKKWLTESEQDAIVKQCRELGFGNGGFFQPSFDSGKKMCLRMMCLGVNWNHKTYKYEGIRAHDNALPPAIPSDFVPLVKRAIEDSHNRLTMDHNIRTQEELFKALPGLDPDVCIVNFYEESGRLGLHQDKDESQASLKKGLPVVSFSIGDTAEFCYGIDRKIENRNKINLESGDVLIFGGESRLVFHSISKMYPGTAPHWLTQRTSLRPGRLNLTFRQISI